MSTAATLIFNPLEDVLPEEKLALELPQVDYGKSLLVAPWRSLAQRGRLHELDNLPQFETTILTFELEDPLIIDAIRRRGCKYLFSTSSYKKCPFKNFTYPDYISSKIVAATEKDIDFSFVGWNNNYLRSTIFQRFGHLPSVIKRDSYNIGVDQRNKEANEYINILSRSRFSLCPRGVGTGTKRIWESLRAGAIPIIISDGWQPPTTWDWANTVIFLTEHSVCRNRNKVPVSIILPNGRERELRENCYLAAEAFTKPTFLASYIKQCLSQATTS